MVRDEVTGHESERMYEWSKAVNTKRQTCSGVTARGGAVRPCAARARYAIQQGIQGPERLACTMHMPQVVKAQLLAAGDGVSVFRL